MKSKALRIGKGTARTYAGALDSYILPAFGDLYYDAIRTTDVQGWIDRMLQTGWTTKNGARKRYSAKSVHWWYRVFRTMTGDAMEPLGLQHDPTPRVQLPTGPERAESNALTPERGHAADAEQPVQGVAQLRRPGGGGQAGYVQWA